MLDRYEMRGIERKEFTDSKTGRRIVQLTANSQWESKSGYYDICPWSEDGTLLALSSARPEDLVNPYRDNVSSEAGQACVMDTNTSEIRVIADDAFYISHSGAFPVWRPKSHVLSFRRKKNTCVVDLDTGEENILDGVIRQVSPDGRRFVGSPSGRDRVEESGVVFVMDIDGSDPRCLATKRQLYDITPNRDEFDISEMTVGNKKWSPDGQSILVAMWVKPRPAVHRSLYIVSRDGSEIRWLAHFGHHHSWTPDGSAILFNDWLEYPADGKKSDGSQRIHLVDFDGSNRRVVIDQPLGSHPIMHPGGKVIADWDRDGLYLVHVEEQRVERVAEFAQRFDMSHRGTHPHCVWSPDGTQLLYNSAESGHSEIYMIPLPELV